MFVRGLFARLLLMTIKSKERRVIGGLRLPKQIGLSFLSFFEKEGGGVTMKKGAITIAMCLMLTLTWLPSAMASNDVLIAMVYPLSGALTETGKRLKAVYEVAAEVINGSYDLPGIPYAKTKGIPGLGGAKIVLKFYDTQASPEIGKAETERIIGEGKAKLIIGCYNSGVSKPASFVAERHKFPFLCAVSSSAELTERGLKYFFRVAPTDYHDSVLFFDFLDEMAAKGKNVKRVAVTCEKTEFGKHATGEILKRAKERGYTIVANVPYAFKATDVNAEVLKIKAAKPDVIIQGSVFSELVLFAKTYKDLGLKTNAILNFCGGFQNPRFASQMGADAEGWSGSCTFAPDFIGKKAHLKKINAMYKEKTGMDMDGIAMESFTTLFVAADVFSRAKSTAPEAVTNALRTTELVIDTMPGKGVKFAENGQNIWIASTLSQVQNGKYRVVWPKEWASSGLWWPMYKK